MAIKLTQQQYYEAHLSKNPAFDGKFFVAVKTTKIYCRNTCPVKKAKLQNVEFFTHIFQAEAAGYRACLRCRPESAPGSAAWVGTSSTVRRALKMMEGSAAQDLSVQELASKLGVGERWLRELFEKQVGANPKSLILAKKLDQARKLLLQSSYSMTEIAFRSGFQSVRRFNDAFKKRFHTNPSEFKKEYRRTK